MDFAIGSDNIIKSGFEYQQPPPFVPKETILCFHGQAHLDPRGTGCHYSHPSACIDFSRNTASCCINPNWL